MARGQAFAGVAWIIFEDARCPPIDVAFRAGRYLIVFYFTDVKHGGTWCAAFVGVLGPEETRLDPSARLCTVLLQHYLTSFTFLVDRVRPNFVGVFSVPVAVSVAVGVRWKINLPRTLDDHGPAKSLLHRHSVRQPEHRTQPREQVKRVRPARAARHLRAYSLLCSGSLST